MFNNLIFKVMIYRFRVYAKKLGPTFSAEWSTEANNATEAEELMLRAIKRLETNHKTKYEYEFIND